MKMRTMKTGKEFNAKRSLGILLLRIFIGLRLLYGVIDNIASWEKMLEFSFFLESFRFPLPVVSAILSVYAQFFAGIFILLGYKIRFFSLIMILNFLIALVFVHLPAKDSIEAMTPALALLFVCLSFLFTGAEDYSLERYFQRRKELLGA